MFEYDNGNMKIYNDIDMNNHKIKNIAPPTDPTDLLMKQTLDIRPIVMFGMINSDHYFVNNGIKLTFNSIYITFIEIYGGNKYLNTQDAFMLSFKNNNIPRNMYLRFRFSSQQPNVILNINKSFNFVSEVQTTIVKNIPFKLSYLPLILK